MFFGIQYIFLPSNYKNRIFFALVLASFLFTVMGKAEGHGDNWHGHVTALTVSPDYRRLGMAGTLMNILEEVSEKYFLFLQNAFSLIFYYYYCQLNFFMTIILYQLK